MRFLLAFFVLLFGAGLHAQNVRLTWIGQACFVLQSEGGPNVVTDPPAANIGYALPQTAADVVTVTHNHGDHNNTAGVRGTFTIVDGRPITARTEMTAAGLPFVLIPGFHDNANGAQRGANTLIRWTQSGMRIAHFGDLGQEQLSEAQLADLQELDLLFIPAGGFFTIDGPRVAALVNQLKPKAAVLMHYRTALGGAAQTAGFPDVASAFPGIVYKPASMTISRTRLPATTEVWLMEAASEAAVVNAAGFNEGVPVAPGSLASLFGTFTGSRALTAPELPLSRRLAETEVLVNGTAVPLLYVSPEQINFQAPGRLATGQHLIEVRVAGQRVARAPMTVVPRSPGVFALLNQDNRVNAAGNPARRNEVVQIFGTGQGEVSPAVEDGAAAGVPVAVTPALPEVTIGGRPATVLFSGLAPAFVGLWQVNAVIPGDAPAQLVQQLTVTYGLTSNIVSVSIQ